MAIGTPYKQAKLAEQWDAIVIGSGIGGLTAAVLLAVHGGKRVLVLERHYEAGGFTHTFHRPGYEWDVGLHYIGQVQDEGSRERRAFDHITAGQVRWQAMPEVYDRIIIEGQTFDLAAGVDRFREGLKQWFPREAGHYSPFHELRPRGDLWRRFHAGTPATRCGLWLDPRGKRNASLATRQFK